MASLGTLLYTRFKGALKGEDQFGNKYYVEKNPPEGRRAKRWVVFKISFCLKLSPPPQASQRTWGSLPVFLLMVWRHRATRTALQSGYWEILRKRYCT